MLTQEVVETPPRGDPPGGRQAAEPAAQTDTGEAERRPDKTAPGRQRLPVLFGDYLEEGYAPRAAGGAELPPIENTLSTGASLSDHLQWQLSLQTTTRWCGTSQRHHRQPRRRRLPSRR